MELEMPLHQIECISSHEDSCTCRMVHNEMLLFDEYHGAKCIKSRIIQLRVRRKQQIRNGENPLISPEFAISDAYLVSANREQGNEVVNQVKRNFPGVRAHDMELIANSVDEKELKIFANTSKFIVNGGTPMTGKTYGNMDSDTDEQVGRLKSYENDLRSRHELEEQRQQEHSFLRSSVRSSKKLQALENNTEQLELRNGSVLKNSGMTHASYANDAYVSAADNSSKSFNTDGPIQLEQVILSVNRVADHLEKRKGREDQSKLLRSFFMQEPVQQAIQATVAQKKPNADEMNCDDAVSQNDSLVSCRMEGNLKIVKIRKTNDAYLGATIRNENDKVIVGRVIRGGLAEKLNLLHENDELIEVNGLDVRGKNVADVCDILRTISGDLSLIVVPTVKSADEQRQESKPTKHYRALFDYDPEDDIYVPCKELALHFRRGDVLHVMNTTDENWWQAYRDGDDPCTSLAGLIPSISFQQHLMLYTRELECDNAALHSTKYTNFFSCTKKKGGSRMKCKKGNELKSADELSTDDPEILTYEEVSLYLSKTGRKRPLVLCGPEGVGCLELRQRLAESDKEKFASAVPHTTRAKKSGEIDGVHYHFVSKQSFQEDAKAGKFIEYGEFQKNLYGTSLASIQDIIDKTKICLLTLKAENLSAMRRQTFMPYVIFVAPPSLQQLRRQKEILGQHGIKDDQLKLILTEGKQTEQQYGHFFDRIIVNVDLDRSLAELKEIVKSLETEPHWVPSFWLRDATLQ